MRVIIAVVVLILGQVFTNDYLFEGNISLIELDKRIIKGIMEPKEGKGDELVKYAFDYHDALESVARMLELEYKPERNIKLIREIQDFGGPHFTKMKVDVDKLNEIYKWDLEDKIRFKSVFEAVRMMWVSLEHHLAKHDAANNITTTPEIEY